MDTLPSEILQKVFQYLPTMDIFNLPTRLVSRGLTRAQAVDHTEAEIWIERECLESFVRLSKNPFMGPNIRLVRLSLERLFKAEKDQYAEAAWTRLRTQNRKDFHETWSSWDFETLQNLDFKKLDGLYSDQHMNHPSLLPHFKSFCAALKDQKRFKKNDEAVDMLKEAISNLPNLEKVRIILDRHGNHICTQHCAKYFRLHEKKWFCTGSRMSRVVMMDACERAGRPGLRTQLSNLCFNGYRDNGSEEDSESDDDYYPYSYYGAEDFIKNREELRDSEDSEEEEVS